MSAPPSPAPSAVSLGPRVVARHPLTPTQRDIWTAQRLHPDTPLANMGKRHRIIGPLDPDRLTAAFAAVVAASPTLRSVFGADERRVLATPPRPTEVIDCDLASLDAWCANRIAQPIDAAGCSYDSVLLRHGESDWTWWLDLHHLVTDAWSSALVFEATAKAYDLLDADVALDDDGEHGQVGLGADALSILDLADVAVEPDPSDPGVRRRAAAWRDDAERFGDQPPFSPYGPRGPRSTEVDRLEVPVDHAMLRAALTDRYASMSDEFSLLGVLAALVGAFAARIEGRTSLTVGVPVHHRTGRRAPKVIGPLMEIVPLRFEIAPDDTFATLTARVQGVLLDVLKRTRPGERPASEVDVVVNVLTARYGSIGGVPTVTEWMRSGHVEPGHVLRVQAYDYGDDLRIEADLQRSLSEGGWQRAFPEHFGRLLAAALSAPDQPIVDVDLLGDAGSDDLRRLNPTIAPGGAARDVPVHMSVRERLRADPDAIVVDHGGTTWDAATFDAFADRFAAAVRAVGATANAPQADVVRIGLRVRRSAELLAAIHGTMRAGASFVLLDPDDPARRHDEIAADAGLAAIIDDVAAFCAGHDSAGVEPIVDLDREAYLLYTSGSTGAPKGVPISHRGLADYLAFAVDTYVIERGVDGADVVMPFHSRTVFDLTITSIFLPMLVGGLTMVVDGDGVEALSAVAEDRRITVLKATPSQLELLTRMMTGRSEIRTVIVGGEAFRRPVAVAFSERCHPDVSIYNEYGPTEAVVGCMIHRFDPGVDLLADVPIGTACPGAEVHLLDVAGRPALPGAWGELYVGRPGMADGYLHRPDLSAGRFVVLPEVSDGPLYRTGDRARLVRPGVLVYGGRNDDQLKVGGVRLEPGEVEAALVTHPRIDNAVVRLWRHDPANIRRCTRCGLGDDVPGVTLDEQLVCSTCRSFDAVAPQADGWFRDDDDLAARLDSARARHAGEIDALMLLSGGKDSTYALYQLVERGWRVHALTLDNGYISDGAIANIESTIADLGITHEFVRTDAMAEIFRDSLDRYANVCNGCYKTIYTLAIARARALGIPTIVTGLSRGQFFETRLVPHQFESGRFDPDAIDATVLEARRVYHATRDAVTESLPEQAMFDDGDPLADLEFVDFYRYVDVDLDALYDFLERRAPWVRPADTGRSTNCIVNDVGIWVHRHERGYHNYAEPYSWDVRLGHKTRAGALDELDDDIDEVAVQRMLAEIGYQPKTGGVLTGWYQTTDGREIDPAELRAHLRERLPERAIPAAFVRIDEVPLAASAKVDVRALPDPARIHRSRAAAVAPTGPTEEYLVAVWADVLGLDVVGATDDFFDLGGASLSALEVVASIDDDLEVDLPDAALFRHRTIAELAVEIDRTQVDPASASGPIPPLDPELPTPMSAGEEAMLLEHLADPDDVRYHVARHYTIAGAVDAERFATAVRRVVDRHGPLHTTFDRERTVLRGDAAVSIDHLPVGPGDDVAAAMTELAMMPFDLRNGPLVRVHLGGSSPGASGEETHVLIVVHHIAVDAATFDLLWSEIGAAYAGDPLPELTIGAGAHAAWQRTQATAHREYWAARRRSGTPSTATFAVPEPAEPNGYLYRTAPLSRSELREGAGTTPFATALAAAALTLGRRTRTDRVDLGVMASTKDQHDAAPLVGYFLNTLPLAVELPPGGTLADVARQADLVIGDAIEHRIYPYADMVRDARRTGEPEPAVTHMLAYEQLAAAPFGEFAADHRILPLGASVADATFFVEERPDSVCVALEYRGSQVDAATADELVDEFGRTLEALCRDPSMPVATWWGATAPADLVGPDLPGELRSVPRRIVDAAMEHPDATAVEGSGFHLTFGEVLAQAAGVADAVTSAAPDARRVGVAVSRNEQLIPAIVGAMLAGAAYVPLDPSMPAERLAELAVAADLDAILVGGDAPFVAPTGVAMIAIAEVSRAGLDRAAELADVIDGSDPAYVIFTSGTTGRPAGIVATHDNLAASTAARAVWYGDGADDRPERFLLTSSIGFDSSLVGLFWPLASGGSVVLAGDDEVHDLDRLAACAQRHRITHALMVPSLYRALIARRADALSDLRIGIVAGEACPDELVAEHAAALSNAQLVNEYGPTETTVWASAAEPTVGRPVTIGGPIAGTRLRVADDRGRPMPIGSIGELWIAGRGVTSGYLATGARAAFVDVDGHRWYRTGDLVRAVDGELSFVGRLDDQLNVGGARLEPAELEAALRGEPGVADAVVVSSPVAGRDVLVAHLERNDGEPDAIAVRAVLADRFPAAVVPRRIVVHDQLPRNVHGKLDRRAASRLPVPAAIEGDRVVARAEDGPLDIDMMRSIWAAALARPDVAPTSDFFDLGGDSLSAVEIVTAVEGYIGREISITTLLVAPTPQRFLDDVSGAEVGAAEDDLGPAVELVRLRAGEPGAPTVVMTAAWDDVFGYQALASALPASMQIVAVVRARPDERYDRVGPFTDEALAVLERAGLAEPGLVIVGWSIGGLVAHELGAALVATDRAPMVVALVDTYFAGEQRHMWSNRWWKYRSLVTHHAVGEIFRELAVTAKRRVGQVLGRLRGRLPRAPESPEPEPQGLTPGGFPVTALDHDMSTRPARTILYAADGTNRARTEHRWRTVVPDLIVVPVHGRHRGAASIMDADRVPQVTDHLAQFVDEHDPAG